MSVRVFLKPERRKVLIALIMPSFHWLFLNFLFHYLYAVFSGIQFAMIYYPIEVYLIAPIILMILSPLYYPFACSVVVLWDYKNGRLNLTRRLKILTASGIVFFNPIGVRLIIKLIIWVQVYYFGRADLMKYLYMV